MGDSEGVSECCRPLQCWPPLVTNAFDFLMLVNNGRWAPDVEWHRRPLKWRRDQGDVATQIATRTLSPGVPLEYFIFYVNERGRYPPALHPRLRKGCAYRRWDEAGPLKARKGAVSVGELTRFSLISFAPGEHLYKGVLKNFRATKKFSQAIVTPHMTDGIWCQPGSFNVPTTLLNTCDYAKRLQESTDPCRYQMQILPDGPCFMEGGNLQGFAGSSRQAPPSLVEVEGRLRRSPDAVVTVIGPVHDKSPGLPTELQRTLEYRDCKRTIGTTVATHRLRSQMPNYAPIRTDIVLDRRKQVDIAGRGRNTRQEMKDAYRAHNKKKYSARGEGVYVPSTALDCVSGSSNVGCSHIAKKDSAQSASSSIGGAVSGSAGSGGLVATIGGSSGGPTATGAAVTPQNQTSGATGADRRSAETIKAASSANFSLPLSDAIASVGRRNAQNLQFYGWKSPCAQQ